MAVLYTSCRHFTQEFYTRFYTTLSIILKEIINKDKQGIFFTDENKKPCKSSIYKGLNIYRRNLNFYKCLQNNAYFVWWRYGTQMMSISPKKK